MPKGNECPQCGAPLGAKATKCRCGWKIEERSSWRERLPDMTLIEAERARVVRWEAAGRPPAEESIARIAKLQAAPKPSPFEHWSHIATGLRYDGRPFPPDSQRIAQAILAARYATQAREPGQDDEELAA